MNRSIEKPQGDAGLQADIRHMLGLPGYVWNDAGEADLVAHSLSQELSAYPALAESAIEQIAQFAAENAAEFIEADLRLCEARPDDLRERDPNKVVLYEESGLVDHGGMLRTQRFTSSGTRSSVASMSDLDAYMGANRKPRLVLTLGAFRTDDLTALDLDYETLIDALAAMGMKEGAIEVLAVWLMSGDAPPELVDSVKAVIVALRMGDNALAAIEFPKALAQFETVLAEVVQRPHTPSFVRQTILPAVQALRRDIAVTPALVAKTRQTLADKIPVSLSDRLSALRIVASTVQAGAVALRDPKLPMAERAVLHQALAGLRVGLHRSPQNFAQIFDRFVQKVMPMAPLVLPARMQVAATPATPVLKSVGRLFVALAKTVVLLTPGAQRNLLPPPRAGAKSWPASPVSLPPRAIAALPYTPAASVAVAARTQSAAAPIVMRAPSAVMAAQRVETAAPVIKVAPQNDTVTAALPPVRHLFATVAPLIMPMAAPANDFAAPIQKPTSAAPERKDEGPASAPFVPPVPPPTFDAIPPAEPQAAPPQSPDQKDRIVLEPQTAPQNEDGPEVEPASAAPPAPSVEEAGSPEAGAEAGEPKAKTGCEDDCHCDDPDEPDNKEPENAPPEQSPEPIILVDAGGRKIEATPQRANEDIKIMNDILRRDLEKRAKEDPARDAVLKWLGSNTHEHGPDCGCGDDFNKAGVPAATVLPAADVLRESQISRKARRQAQALKP